MCSYVHYCTDGAFANAMRDKSTTVGVVGLGDGGQRGPVELSVRGGEQVHGQRAVTDDPVQVTAEGVRPRPGAVAEKPLASTTFTKAAISLA